MISQMLSSAAKTGSEETMEVDDVLPGPRLEGNSLPGPQLGGNSPLPGLGLGGNSPLHQTHQTQNGCTDEVEMDQVETPVKTVRPVAGDVDEFTGIVVKQEEQCSNGIDELTIEPCVTPTSDKHPYEKANSSENDEDSPLSDQSDDAGDSDNIPSDVSPDGTLREIIKCESFVDTQTLPPAGVLGTHLKAEMVDAPWDCYDQLVPLAINPRGSLLELAQKLRIANKRMWGSDNGNLLASPSNSDKRVNTGSSALQKHLLDTAAASDAESPEKGSPLNNILLKEKITAVGNQLWKVLLRIDPNDTAAPVACNSDALCVRGPSLWPVLAATKDNPLFDYGELVESFKARNTSHAATDALGLESSTGLTPPLPLNDYQIENIESNAIDFVVKTKVPKLYAKKTAGEMRHVGRKGMLPQDFLPRKHRCQYYLCNYQTDNKSHLRRHESSVHCAVKGYFCYVCNKDFSRTEKVKAHFVKMHAGVVYDSKLCRRVALSPSELTGPHRDSTGKFVSPPKLCQDDKECDAVGSAASSSTISSHLAAHLLSDPDVTFMQAYQSLVCDPQQLDVCDPTVPPLVDNVSERSHSSYTTPRLLGKKCPHCTYVSRDMWHLKRHLTDVHSEQKAFSCPVCCYSSSRRHRLMTHLVTHGVLYCLYCAFSADDLDAFRTHQRVCTQQHGATTLTCMFCGERCAGETELQDHASLVHQSHFYICTSCPFFTGNVAAFETHQQQHSSEQHCDESLPESTNQQEPVSQKPKSMGNVGLFNCPHCDFTSKYRNVLRKHLSRHPGEIYTCGVAGCDYRTTDRSLLERHTRGQHGQQVETLSYPCPMCLRPPFKYKRSLEKHILNHMQTDEKCAVCGARFLLKAQLDKHMETEHVETEHIETEHMESEPTETKHSVTEHTETEQTDAEHMETEHTEHIDTEHTETEHTATEHKATEQTEHMDTEDTETEHSVTEQTEHVETEPTVTDPTQTEQLESEHKTIDAVVSSDDAGSDLSHLDDVNDTRGATDDPVVGLGDQVETPLTAIDGDVSIAMTLTKTGGASIDS